MSNIRRKINYNPPAKPIDSDPRFNTGDRSCVNYPNKDKPLFNEEQKMEKETEYPDGVDTDLDKVSFHLSLAIYVIANDAHSDNLLDIAYELRLAKDLIDTMRSKE